jgi:hypothetical protein
VDVVRGEIAAALVDEAVTGEVDKDAVVVLGDGGEPGFEFMADVGEGSAVADEFVDVFGAEVAALGADEDGVDGLGVAFGVLELGVGG